MKNESKAIFLVGYKMYKNNFLSILLEKSTQYRVFSFFSEEESLLYQDLNPTLVIHDEDSFMSSTKEGFKSGTLQTYFPNHILRSGEYAKVIPQIFKVLNSESTVKVSA